MPIFNMNGQILIAHPVAGLGEEIEQLGEMSTELAIWLDGKLLESSIAPKIQNDNKSGLSTYWDQPHLAALNARCMIAASKGYKNPLSDKYGELTPLGQDKANQAQKVIQIINDNSPTGEDYWAYQPNKWKIATDVLIKATIPIRALTLLDMIEHAVSEAEQTYNVYSTEHPNETQDPQTPDILDLNPNSPQSPTDRPRVFQGERRVADFYEVEKDTEVTQKVNACLYLIGTRRREAWVPTATFGQRARSDLKVLVRFGLVSLKAYIAGGRGRPRHVLRVSPPGRIIINDMAIRKILD